MWIPHFYNTTFWQEIWLRGYQLPFLSYDFVYQFIIIIILYVVSKRPQSEPGALLFYAVFIHSMAKKTFYFKALTSPVHDKTEQIDATDRQRRKSENRTNIFMVNIDQTNSIAKINF